MRRFCTAVCLASLFVYAASAQKPDSIELGNFEFRPEAGVSGVYDNRVNYDPNRAEDFYSEAEASVRMNNLPAVVNFSAFARYGYRFYNTYDDLNDDVYDFNAFLNGGDRLRWGLSANWNKTLSYRTTVNPDAPPDPDEIIADGPSRKFIGRGNISYDISMTEKTSLRPEFSSVHYYQEFATWETAEWQTHTLGIQWRREHSEKTVFFAGASAGLQVNDDEDGTVGSFSAGAEGRPTHKTSWEAELGYTFSDYENSGRSDGILSNMRINWQITEKVSVYAHENSDFQPGLNNESARWTIRFGYGAGWRPVEKINFTVSMLHDYEDLLDENTSVNPRYGVVRSFFRTGIGYLITERFSTELGYSYTNDEFTPDKQVVSLRLNYDF